MTFVYNQCSTVVLTLLQERPEAKPMGYGKIGDVRTLKPLNRLSQNLAWVIMSAISPLIPKLKPIAPMGESLSIG